MNVQTPAQPTPARIQSKALELFATKGYDATSVREICDAAGIAKPTLYHFFGSKEGVYRSLVDGTLEAFSREMSEHLRAGAVAERLRRVARGYFRTTRENRRLMRFIFALIHNPPSSAPATDFPAFYERMVHQVAAVVEEGVAAGELQPGRTDLRMLILMGAMSETVVSHLIAGRPALDDALADELVDTVVDAWRAR